MDDRDIYRRFLEGSIEAFEQLVLQHKDRLIYFLLKYTGGDHYLAEDMAQEAFAAVYVHKEQYNFSVSFKTWLFTIARNKAVDAMRKQSRLQTCSFDESMDFAVSIDPELEERICQKEEQRQLHQAICNLKPDYQKAIQLIDLEDLSYADAARVMDKTLVQTRVLIHRARAALRQILSREMIS
jgi:RNA polymerase sigma-70 factor (ECF subfamily)